MITSLCNQTMVVQQMINVDYMIMYGKNIHIFYEYLECCFPLSLRSCVQLFVAFRRPKVENVESKRNILSNFLLVDDFLLIVVQGIDEEPAGKGVVKTDRVLCCELRRSFCFS